MENARKINVLHLIETSEPGGSESVLAYIVKNLDSDNYSSLVCLLGEGWLTQKLSELGIEYMILRNDRPYDPIFLKKLIQLIKRRRIDIIHSHEFMMNIYGSVAGKLSGIPMVGTVHGKLYFPEKKSRILSYKLAVALCSRMVLVSEDLKAFFIQTLGLRNQKKLLMLYNGIDIDKYAAIKDTTQLKIELGIKADSVVACTIGSLFKVKGIPYLLEAVDKVRMSYPDFKLLIAGEGNQMDDLQKQARALNLGDTVCFMGFRDDIPGVLSISDFYICSSLSEGLSLSILEAIAASKPVIATRVGGNPEIIQDGRNGYLVPPADSESLADKIKCLIGNANLRKEMGLESARTAREKFSLRQMILNYQNLYDQLLRRNI